MRISTLLRELFGFSRTIYERISIEDEEVIVDVRVRGRARCPGCKRKGPIYDHREARTWRHLDFGGRCCRIRARLRRVQCRRCDTIRAELVPWAAPGLDYTYAFEDLVGWLAQQSSQSMVEQLCRIAWRTVGKIVMRVKDRRSRPIDPEKLGAIGVDELSWRKGHYYVTVVTDLDSGRVIWVGEGKGADTLASFFKEIGPEACARIRHAAIDMSAAYEKAILEYLPNATLVFDRFHVQKLVSEAVDSVRREEWQRLRGTTQGDAIKHSRWALLKNPWNLTQRQGEKLANLQSSNERLYRAYLLKESFAGIYGDLPSTAEASTRLDKWLAWASRSKLEPFQKLARTIRRHRNGILAFFETGYTNGLTEGMNNKARLATRRAYGFHRVQAVMAMIELCCGGIQIPIPHLPAVA